MGMGDKKFFDEHARTIVLHFESERLEWIVEFSKFRDDVFVLDHFQKLRCPFRMKRIVHRTGWRKILYLRDVFMKQNFEIRILEKKKNELRFGKFLDRARVYFEFSLQLR